MQNLFGDVWYGLRVLRKSPGFTAIAVLAMGLGVGVNTSVFSLADVLVYRPLLVPDLDRLVVVQATRPSGESSEEISVPDLLDWGAQSQTVEHLAGTRRAIRNPSGGGGEPMVLVAALVTPPFFDALIAKPELGRVFLPEEGEKGRDHVVVLTHSFWGSRYGASPDILKRTIKLEGEDYQVVGVMPKDFEYPQGAHVLIPAAFTNAEKSAHDSFPISAIGRLKPGVSMEQADTEFRMLARRSQQKYPTSHTDRSARVNLLRKNINGDADAFMRMLNGAALFVLLIACANVASLQFARISSRTREIAVRSAMGAARSRLVGQFLTESALLGAIGALAGIAFAEWGTYVLRAALPPEVARYVPGWSRLGVDWHALAYAMGLSVVSGALAGIAPALLASRADLVEGLKAGGRGMSASRGRQRIRGTLVVTEIVLAVVLLVGAGLMVNGVQRLAEPGPNIHPEKVLTLWMNLPETRYPKPQQRARFQDDVLHGFASLPGVQSAALASALPYASPPSEVVFAIEGRAVAQPGTEPGGERAAVSAGYFQNLRIQLQKGRLFDDRDSDGAPNVAIVSQHLARRYFAGEDAVGRRVRLGPADAKNPWCTIVGVVADIRRNPWDHEIIPAIYQPFRQAPGQRVHFLLRTAGDPLALIGAARAEVARVDPDQPIQDIRTYRKTMDHALIGLVYVASMMAVFGVIALLLSAAGVYGVMACSVAERTREIGLRMALGAQDRDVVWMVGRWGVLLTAGGLALGIPAAFGLAGLLRNLVYGVGAHDLVSFAAGIFVLCAAAMLACYLPVRRALSVDPIVTLRTE